MAESIVANPEHHDLPEWLPGESREVKVYGVPVTVTKIREEEATFFRLVAKRLDFGTLESEAWSEGNVPSYAAELAARTVLTQIVDGSAYLKRIVRHL